MSNRMDVWANEYLHRQRMLIHGEVEKKDGSKKRELVSQVSGSGFLLNSEGCSPKEYLSTKKYETTKIGTGTHLTFIQVEAQIDASQYPPDGVRWLLTQILPYEGRYARPNQPSWESIALAMGTVFVPQDARDLRAWILETWPYNGRNPARWIEARIRKIYREFV